MPPKSSMSNDDRPIKARGSYDMSFFDTDNEYERFRQHQHRMDEATFRSDFRRLTTVLSSAASFNDPWTYERLSALDAQVAPRGGLTVSQMCEILRPATGIEADCAICLERSAATDRMCVLNCSHAFHVDCMTRWLEAKNTCPLCRKDLRPTTSAPAAGGAPRATHVGAGGRPAAA
jgi:hypothetical protein